MMVLGMGPLSFNRIRWRLLAVASRSLDVIIIIFIYNNATSSSFVTLIFRDICQVADQEIFVSLSKCENLVCLICRPFEMHRVTDLHTCAIYNISSIYELNLTIS